MDGREQAGGDPWVAWWLMNVGRGSWACLPGCPGGLMGSRCHLKVAACTSYAPPPLAGPPWGGLLHLLACMHAMASFRTAPRAAWRLLHIYASVSHAATSDTLGATPHLHVVPYGLWLVASGWSYLLSKC